jgi:multidrug efflux pump subunit AcrB
MWITRVSINNPVFATMVMVALCVLGLFQLTKLGVEQMPDISFPGAWMEVRYPGRQPRGGGARDRQAAGRGRQQRGRRQAHHLAQRRRPGWPDQHRVRRWTPTWAARCRRCATASRPCRAAFPKDAKAPTIARWNNDNSQPVVNAALLSKTRSGRELSILGDQVVGKRLQRVEGVARVEISGLTVREVRIDLDPCACAPTA